MNSEAINVKKYIVCALIMLLAFFLSFITLNDYGITWDEAHYLKDARAIFMPVGEQKNAALSGNKDYPPLGMYFIGLSLKHFDSTLGTVRAMRLPACVAFTMVCGILFLFACSFSTLSGAIFASLSFLLMPRVFPEAHFAALDMLTALFWVLCALCFYKGIERPVYAVLFAFLLGFGFAVRFSLLFLTFPLFLWAFLFKRRESAGNLYAFLSVFPFTFYSIIARLWTKPVDQISFFVQSNLARADWDRVPVFFRGKAYLWTFPYAEPAHYPWDYPFIMLAVTVPLLVLFVFLLGAFSGIDPFDADKKEKRFFSFIQFILPLCVFAIPSVPKYDGVRFYLPSIFFLCCICAPGFDSMLETASRLAKPPLFRFMFYFFFFGALLDTFLFSHPYGLEYYNELVGNAGGAFKRGFETTYWGDALSKKFFDEFGAENFTGKKVLFAPFTDETFTLLQTIGWLPRDVQWQARIFITKDDLKNFDYIVLQTRQGCFSEVSWVLLSKGKPAYQIMFRGAPLLSVYRMR